MFFRFGLKLGFMDIPFCDRNNMNVSVPGQRKNFVYQGVRDFLLMEIGGDLGFGWVY